MAQTTHFIRFIEDTNLEYIYPIDKIQSINVTSNTAITITIAPGNKGVGQTGSVDTVVFVCPAGKSSAVADEILDTMVSACCGGLGSQLITVAETNPNITSIDVTLD